MGTNPAERISELKIRETVEREVKVRGRSGGAMNILEEGGDEVRSSF